MKLPANTQFLQPNGSINPVWLGFLRDLQTTVTGLVETSAEVLTGTTSPQGLVEAEKGTLYVDKENGKLYVKESRTDEYGWTVK